MADFLGLSDGLVRLGIQSLSEAFTDMQARLVARFQRTDGGFAGRHGASDIYYTDFALRTLVAVAPNSPTLRDAAAYLANADPPQDIIECFCALNCRRNLAACGMALPTPPDTHAVLEGQRVPGGGYGRPGDGRLSVYQTFIGALCHEMLGTEIADGAGVAEAILSLRGPRGGFCEHGDSPTEQTNATAAALSVLMMLDTLEEDVTGEACRFIASMQAEDGGLRAHAAAPMGDLLSAFTGLLTTAALGRPEAMDLAGMARFLRRVAMADGGFGSVLVDQTSDTEYIYYGLGALGLLRLFASGVPAGREG